MEKKNLVDKKIITKTGCTLSVVGVEGTDNIKEIILRLNDKKIYNLYFAFKSGFIKFEDEDINKELTDYINNENSEIERKKKLEQERIKEEQERIRKEKEQMENAIKEFRNEFYFLSNFYEADVTYDGYTYRNNESAFQAQKDLTRRIQFTELKPNQARSLGRKVNLRSDWEQVKVKIMEEIVRCKFDQHPDLKEKLIDTGDRLLIEGNTWNDTFWGVCKGKGKNNLGLILMKIRKEYQQ